MFKPTFFLTLFLLFCGSALPQEISHGKFTYDLSSLDFWSNTRVMPVRFLEKNDDKDGNTHLLAIFSSNFIVEQIGFILPAHQEQDAFFEQNKEWEEQIDRKTFLKKYKKDFWLVTYLKAGTDNIVVGAHQFKQWGAVKQSYASHPDQLRKSVDNPGFWRDIRIRLAFFYAFDGDKAYWMFLNPIDKKTPFEKSDTERLALANGQLTKKRIIGNPLFDLRVLDQGMFFIQKNTVFHKQEMESSKARRVLKFTLSDAKLRLRPFPTDREYFIQNAPQQFWICFYDSELQSLVRVVEALNEPD